MAHIYPYIGMLTHDLPALREPAIEYFLSFWQEIRSILSEIGSRFAKQGDHAYHPHMRGRGER